MVGAEMTAGNWPWLHTDDEQYAGWPPDGNWPWLHSDAEQYAGWPPDRVQGSSPVRPQLMR